MVNSDVTGEERTRYREEKQSLVQHAMVGRGQNALHGAQV